MWVVVYLPEAEAERVLLPANERNALHNAVAKLEAIGPRLGYPHTSLVRSATNLRELRPRAGRSPWRGLYRQVDDRFAIAAIAPEAETNPQEFKRACTRAEERLANLED